MRIRRRFWVFGVAGLLCALLVGGLVDYRSHRPIATVAPPADAQPGRWVVLDGANNARDIGGYPTRDGRHVRWKTVYRSGELSGLTSVGGQAFARLGIRRVIDFRYRSVCTSLFGGDASCVFRAAAVTLLPVRAGNLEPAGPEYVQRVRENREPFRRAFELLADPANRPILFHCQAGKDRTGIMAALTLTLVGVDRETVVKGVNRQAIIDLLDEVERQGGIDNYLANLGVSAATRAAIREALVE
jgi:protein-tyrosine phosphatase